MEDVVALVATDHVKGNMGFITWGRTFDPVDESPLLAAVRPNLTTFGLNVIEELRVCESLIELAACKFFYEGLLSFARERIPFGSDYATWATSKCEAITSGRELYCVGPIPFSSDVERRHAPSDRG